MKELIVKVIWKQVARTGYIKMSKGRTTSEEIRNHGETILSSTHQLYLKLFWLEDFQGPVTSEFCTKKPEKAFEKKTLE